VSAKAWGVDGICVTLPLCNDAAKPSAACFMQPALRRHMIGSTCRIAQYPDKSSNFAQGNSVMNVHIQVGGDQEPPNMEVILRQYQRRHDPN
jgi:hypothetical protein